MEQELIEHLVKKHESILAPEKRDGLVQTTARLEMRDASRSKVMWILVSAIVAICVQIICSNLGWL